MVNFFFFFFLVLICFSKKKQPENNSEFIQNIFTLFLPKKTSIYTNRTKQNNKKKRTSTLPMKRTEGTLSFRTQQTEVLSKNQEFRFHPFCTYLQVFFFSCPPQKELGCPGLAATPERQQGQPRGLAAWLLARCVARSSANQPKTCRPPAAPASPGETPAPNPPQLRPAGLCSLGDLQVGIWGGFFY